MEENKKQIIVEKHKWPDEIRNEKKKNRNRLLIGLAIILAFTIGYVVPRPSGNESSSNNNQKVNASDKFGQIESILTDKWYFGKDIKDINNYVIDNAIKGMANSNKADPHTQYLDKKEASALMTSLSGSLIGIGIQYFQLGEDIMVDKVFMDAPAQDAGIKEGDIIKKVDGVNIAGKEIDAIREMILGDEGTKVSIEVLRGSETLEFTVVREKVSVTVYGYIEKDTGVLEISSFSEDTAAEVEKYLNMFDKEGVSNLVIDLRGNGGGYVETAIQITGLLTGPDKIVLFQEDKEGKQLDYFTPKTSQQHEYKTTAVLVDGNTASASELLTAALKKHIGTKVIGVKTYGKGTVQSSLQFNDGSIFKYTVAEWLTPDKEKINRVGISPDIEVKLDAALSHQPASNVKDTYEVDSVGALVKDTQVYLKFLGYDIDRVDGYYSQATNVAVKKYQTDSGMKAAGIITQDFVNSVLSSTSRKWHDERTVLDKQMIKALEVVHGT